MQQITGYRLFLSTSKKSSQHRWPFIGIVDWMKSFSNIKSSFLIILTWKCHKLQVRKFQQIEINGTNVESLVLNEKKTIDMTENAFLLDPHMRFYLQIKSLLYHQPYVSKIPVLCAMSLYQTYFMNSTYLFLQRKYQRCL